MTQKKKILLVEPNFPIPQKSKNHKNFLPIGLLKIASYLMNKGDDIKLVRGKGIDILDFQPDEIWITSLFTYWSKYVRNAVQYYKKIFPNAKIIVGGIYASLMPEHCKKYTGCDEVWRGIYTPAEKYLPAYKMVKENPHPLDYQIIHASRGCIRRCPFCGTWKIEPEFKAKESIKDEIKYRKIVFYDNNFLANEHIENILNELIELKKKKKILWCESQSGFDGRLLKEKPYLGKMIKKAGFRYPRIAWDWDYNQYKEIKEQIDILISGGYRSRDIFVFMLYNWDIPFEEMEKKRVKCWEWKVQIAGCRYRPLDQTYDHYNPRKTEQTKEDYYIHKDWTDKQIKKFTSNVRRQNICIRYGVDYYSAKLERKKISKDEIVKYKKLEFNEASKYLDDAWNPAELHYPE
jgi:hypothetical protein